MNVLVVMMLAFGVFAEEDWIDNYEGAHYVLTTLLIFVCLFVVLITVSILFAVAVTLREWLAKRKNSSQQSDIEKIDAPMPI